MSIGSISIGTRKCLLVGGQKSNKTRVQLKFRVTTKYRLALYMDDKPFGGYQWTVNRRYKYNKQTQNKEEIDTIVYIDVPSDGRNHSIYLKDVNSSDRSPSTNLVSIGCEGGVVPTVESMVEDPATNEKIYTISLYHDGRHKKNLTGYVWLSGKVVGGGVNLKPRQKAYRQVVIPATGSDNKYTVKAGFSYGKTLVKRTLWFIVDANDPPVTDPGQWNSTTTFDPGETVVIGSAVGEVPLQTDGSEWLLLEYSPAALNNWTPFGEDGLVEPDDDGTWAYEVETGPGTPFTANTSWKVRARRFRDYRESEPVEHTFSITSTPHTPPTYLKPPTITNFKSKTVKSGTRVTISGTGPPGARIYWESYMVTAWGTKGALPKSTTVKKNGKWKTTVRTTFVDNNKKKAKRKAYKRVAYYCRARLNGRWSGYSNQVTIRWNRKK